jgi:hypothetical protein
MSRRGKTYRKIALALMREGHALARNGHELGELEDQMGGRVGEEARLRVLAGGIVHDVAAMLLMDASHRSTMGRLRQLGKKIRAAIAAQKVEQ